MIYRPERRPGFRLDVPRHLSASLFESRPARLLDLSAEGARIEHPDAIREAALCFLFPPPPPDQPRRLEQAPPAEGGIPGRWTHRLLEWPQLCGGDARAADGASSSTRASQ